MDHGGQFEEEGKVMSQLQVGGVDLCDNLPNPEALSAAQTRNLNEANTLTQTQSPSPSQNDNGKDEEGEQGKEGYKGTDREEEDDEEDIDEVMKEEEDESEGSSCRIHCQSPDTPMTDSSYSETGSLLETSPTSPVIPEVCPETAYPICPVELSQSDAEVDFDNSNTGSFASNTGSITCTLGPAFTTGPIESTALTITSDTRLISPAGPSCITETTARTAKNTNSTTEHLTSSTEPVVSHACTRGPATPYAEPITSPAETFTVTACTTRLNASIASSPMSATTGPITVTTGPTTTGPVTSPALLASLDQLAHRGDDTHFPQYLHQIAEAFVHHEDYQQALWCIQLERLYHQRVLDNLNALQEQWGSHCRRTSSGLATQHLDTLRHICQTHSRPRTGHAVCASLDILRPVFEEGVIQPSCTSVHQIEGGMEQRAEDSSHSQSSHPATPSINSEDSLNSPEKSEKNREDPDGKLQGRDGVHGTPLTDREGGGAPGYTISVRGNGLHPFTAGEMDQSKPAEQQGGDLGPVQEKEAKKEEEQRNVEQAEEALEMEDEAEDEEEEKQKERDSPFCQKALPVETLVSEAEVEVQQLHQEAQAEEKLHEETQESNKTCLHQEAHLSEQAHIKQQEQGEEGEVEEEEEEEYEVQQVDISRQAATLDDMAKLITVEELSPASGLVSILKKRSVRMDNMSASASSEPRPDKPPNKRRVRFKVPDDAYDQDVGSGDSCLLLFLLCLVTVVISVGGTALYCALGDAHSSVCQDFSRNADFYFGQIQRGISQIQHWFTPGS
ncbi:consortin [Scomber scombrus]|uniref:Consortin n=1 Tax=Scomber scombrus TaxID=13677 RepID=A0AAV1P0S2_SCOSC|nr:consortin isoform X2 [Scomber scombrus]